MRKITVLTFVTLDGVVQSPGASTEDPSGGFTYGGWLPPYFDEVLGQTMGEQMGQPFDLLLGRKTFEYLRLILAAACRGRARDQQGHQIRGFQYHDSP